MGNQRQTTRKRGGKFKLVKIDKVRFGEEMEKLSIFYPSWGVGLDNAKSSKAWYDMLTVNGFTTEELIKTVTNHIKTIKFNPTIASLIECRTGDTKKLNFIDLNQHNVTYVE